MINIPTWLLLPPAMAWVRATVRWHAGSARPIRQLDISEFSLFFSNDTLDRSRVVLVDSIPAPPLVGVLFRPPGIAANASPSGLTLQNTIFLRKDMVAQPIILFHELVHVVQWSILGNWRFLATYLDAMVKYGYQGIPLEKIAYDLAYRFNSKPNIPFSVEEEVRASLLKETSRIHLKSLPKPPRSQSLTPAEGHDGLQGIWNDRLRQRQTLD